MLDPAIETFFSERAEGWMKKNTKASMSEEELQNLTHQCEEVFCLENWLPSAAKRAGQMSISTHPCTFSHPSSRKNKNGYATSIIADSQRLPDGFLRSGNVEVAKDALGNAAALDVYKFLTVVMANGKSVIEHIQEDSEGARQLLNIQSESYDTLRNGFLAMIQTSDKNITSSKIKQVYFPVDDDYHQLSILSNSGIVFELRKRIDALRFSDKVKKGREKRRNNEYSEEGFSEIYDITTIGYGGTKPQNISVLNNQNGGKAHLLMSAPPALKTYDVRFPKKNFFEESIRYYTCKNVLERFHRVLIIKNDSCIPQEHQRTARDNCLADILDKVIEVSLAVRAVSDEQYREDSSLPRVQKLWLNPTLRKKEETQWLDDICVALGRWVVQAYKHVNKKPIILGEAERVFITEYFASHKEVLL